MIVQRSTIYIHVFLINIYISIYGEKGKGGKDKFVDQRIQKAQQRFMNCRLNKDASQG